MKALLVAAVLLIKILFGQANKQAVGQSRFLQDFVEFYNIKHVCFIKNDQKLRILQTVAQLASSSHIYVSVVDAAGSQVHNATSSHITNSVARCEGLIMMQLQTQFDQAFFKMIFNGPQTKSRWLLLSDQTFREMLRPLYLPINNIVKCIQKDIAL
nr:uncharacterized protein LOC113804482 [Penaeus vannamei]